MTDPLPRRIAWFAPWTWKRRTWLVLSPFLAVAIYIGTIPAVVWLVSYTGYGIQQAYWAYRPLRLIRKRYGPSTRTIADIYPSLFAPKTWEYWLFIDKVRAVNPEGADSMLVFVRESSS